MKIGKKGVSPVIAVLLLIVIAVAAAVLTYLWVLGYIGTMQSSGGTESFQEKVKIEAVDISGGYLRGIYVRNIGDVQARINSVYLVYPSGDSDQIYTGTTTLNPGAVTYINTSDRALTSGTTYTVKVTTQSGVEATYVFTYRT